MELIKAKEISEKFSEFELYKRLSDINLEGVTRSSLRYDDVLGYREIPISLNVLIEITKCAKNKAEEIRQELESI